MSIAKKRLFALISVVAGMFVCATLAIGQQPSNRPETAMGPPPVVGQAVKHDLSPALRDVPAIPLVAEPPAFREIPRQPLPRRGPKPGVLDPVIQASPGAQAIPLTLANFEGVSNSAQSGVSGFTVVPPDTNGDVGPNHYVQWVNLAFAVYDKTGGMLPGYPKAGKALWAGFGGPCETGNDGDPIVLYDHLADRWLMSQFALPNYPSGPFYQCIAVSQTGDPTGSYHRYAFLISQDKMNDYPKFGVWPDGYYMSVNQFKSSSWAGQGVIAFERGEMLAGHSARSVSFDLYGTDPNLGGMLPSDLDGPSPPPGTPNYFVQVDDDAWGYSPDQLQVWAFAVDWNTPGNSSFAHVVNLPTAPFDSNMCGYSTNCIPQSGSGRKLDAISDRLMYRLQYRDFGTHASLVTNHTVDVDGFDHAGIRWYELRDNGTGWAINQQGTYAPDGNHRWMGSAAMDGSGNIALGFSLSGKSMFPSIRYTGRLSGDTPGEMTLGEAPVIGGTGSQTGASRWGDYSMMAVDPADDSTFWYTQEYYQSSSGTGWQTRIGSFKLSGISPPPPPPASLTVQSPNGGERWKINTNKTIQWTSGGVSGDVRIELSRNGGASWTVLFSSTPNDGSQTWKVTGPATTAARIRITSGSDSGIYDASDGNFVIK